MLHAWLERAAQRWPDRPAIVDSEGQVTFRRLRADAAGVSGTLKRMGVAHGDRVAIVLDKSREAIVALYGALMAGAVYVPIPPAWPRDRVDVILRECGARIVIARPATDVAVALVDRETGDWKPWPAGQDPEAGEPPGGGDPGSEAFILFTSGSTGTPKGVTLSHAAVGAFVEWLVLEFGLGPDDRLSCPSPLSFDLSTFDVFCPVISGAACVLLPEPTRWLPRLLLDALVETRVTAWYSVPSALAIATDNLDVLRGRLDGLRVILLAGEVLPPRLAAALRGACPRARILNLYGPTESNVVTWYDVPDHVETAVPVPIGVACPYARLRVVDADGRLRETGELWVAGDSLMAGYWASPEETTRAFVDVDEPGGIVRYYRTGDMVTTNADGTLGFRGRLDRQFKRRGIRVEPGDVEAALALHPDVAEAAVILSSGDRPQLVAYVAPLDGRVPILDELHARCLAALPAAMVPDRFVLVSSMPRNSRGKIDYRSLGTASGDP
jgi:L-proline---[L-prolyl-carrier protein] ligase